MTAKTKFLLFVLIAVLIFAGYFATAYSKQARNSGLDILFDVLHSVFFAAALFILVKVHPERWIKIISTVDDSIGAIQRVGYCH